MSSCCTKAPSPMCSWWFGRMRRTRPRVEGPTASVREEYTATATVFKRNSKTYEVFRRGGDIVARVHLVCIAPGRQLVASASSAAPSVCVIRGS